MSRNYEWLVQLYVFYVHIWLLRCILYHIDPYELSCCLLLLPLLVLLAIARHQMREGTGVYLHH